MEEKLYTTKELLEIIGCSSINGGGATKTISKCKSAGLIVEQATPTQIGKPIYYRIIKNECLLEGEEWRECFINSNYEVSNFGRARTKKNKKLVGTIGNKGYVKLKLKNGEENQYIDMQRAVYFSFHPEQIESQKILQIDHINGIRTDNRLDNLRALSNIENINSRDKNQGEIKTITTRLVQKFGYEKTIQLLNDLLNS